MVIVRKLEIDRVRTLALSYTRNCFCCLVESDLEIMRVFTEYSLINNFPVPVYWHISSMYLILSHDCIPKE